MHRRSFFSRSLALASVAWWPHSLSATPKLPAATAPPASLALLCPPDELRAIGDAYLDTCVDEATLPALNHLLPPTHAALRAQVRADFDAGDIVYPRGWVLSRTEARQCARYALTRP